MRKKVVLLPLLLGGCTVVFGGRPEACGVYPAGGGPAAIVTRDQELCDVVRLRVLSHLDGLKGLTRARIDTLIDKTVTWESWSTLERLLAAVRAEGGDAMADEVQRALDAVLERSTRPMPADCDDVQRCLVQGVAKGIRIALLYAEPSPVPAAADAEASEPPK